MHSMVFQVFTFVILHADNDDAMQPRYMLSNYIRNYIVYGYSHCLWPWV